MNIIEAHRVLDPDRRLRVLHVEDNPGDIELVRIALLRSFPLEVHLENATSLGEALHNLEGTEIDVILLDLHLPDSQGLETLAALRRSAPDATIVVLTGWDDDRRIGDVVRMGTQGYVAKSDIQGRTLAREIRLAVERKKLEDHLVWTASHDPLTGLPNRRCLEEELDRALLRSRRYGENGALILLDVDRFKHFNDTLGHATGDSILQAVADVLRNTLRASDLPARVGGDEFVVVMPLASARDAALAVTRAKHELTMRGRRLGIPEAGADGRESRITLSAGIAEYGHDHSDVAELMRRADAALYAAKRNGRDDLRVWKGNGNGR